MPRDNRQPGGGQGNQSDPDRENEDQGGGRANPQPDRNPNREQMPGREKIDERQGSDMDR